MPDGTKVNFPDEMGKDEIRSLISKKFPDVQKDTRPEWIQSTEKVLQQDIPDVARTVLRGATLGQLADVQGMVSPELEARERERMARVGKEYPIVSAVADIGGSLLGGGALAKLAPSAYQSLIKYGAKGVPQAIATGSGVGAVSGGLYGAGTSEDKMQGAKEGALYGGLGGVVGVGAGALAPSIVKGGRGLKERAMRLFGKNIDETPLTPREIAEISDVAPSVSAKPEVAGVSKVESAIKQDFPENYQQVLDAWKSGDESLAEMYGAKSRQLAKGAAQYPTGQARAEEFFSAKTMVAPEKIKESISKNISSSDAYYATVDDVLDSGRSGAKDLYKDAYKGSVDINLKPEVASAIEKARSIYPSELNGVPDNAIKTLDYAKRVLDDDIGKAMRSGEGNLARSRTLIKNELLNAMDSASPSYAKARKASGDYLSLTNAMEDGKNFMKTDPELLSKKFKSLGDQEKLSFRVGVSKQMRDLIDKTPEGQNPYNRIIGRPEQQNRLKAILSPVQYKNLVSDAKAQDRMFKLRNEVLGGSPTTSKAVAAGEIAGLAGDLATAGVSGAPVQAVAVGGLRKLFDGLSDNTAKQVSDILFEQRPTEKLKIYNAILGNKNLSNSERKLLKESYFKAQDIFNTPEIKGALMGGVGANIEEDK